MKKRTTQSRMLNTVLSSALVAACLGLGGVSWADCPTIDFDELAINTAVTTQYRGVTFSVRPQTCNNNPTLYMRVYAPPDGTSSGTKCIKIDQGCPSFSEDYLRMVFELPQREVSFTLGDWAETYTVRYYTNTSGSSGLIGSFNVAIPPAGGGDVGVHRRVTVTSANHNIRRIEVQGANSAFEAIDDLTYNVDTSAPVAEITSPSQLDCVCNNTVVVGSAYDPDFPINRWQLQRKALGATAWTLVRLSTTSVTNDTLATWTTQAPDGYYTLRLTVENSCGLETVWTTDVYLNKAFNSLSLRSPGAGQILGGTVCADGSAWDHCSGTLALEHRPAGGGPWQSFDSVSTNWVINDPLGSWDTRAVADGNYDVRLIGIDECANSVTNQIMLTVDNTPPTALISSLTPCATVNGVVEIRGTVDDLHLQSWALQYAGGPASSWVTIAAGNGSVVNGLLGNWDTTSLAPCAYLLRLVATDAAVRDCNGALRNQTEHLVSVTTQQCGVVDADADGMPDVWESAHFLNPQDPSDAAADPDGDGQNNLQEYLAGTDPRLASSALKMLNIQRSGNDLIIGWASVTNRLYGIYRADGIGNPTVWKVLTSGVPATGPIQSWKDSNALSTGNPNLRLYRVGTQP